MARDAAFPRARASCIAAPQRAARGGRLRARILDRALRPSLPHRGIAPPHRAPAGYPHRAGPARLGDGRRARREGDPVPFPDGARSSAAGARRGDGANDRGARLWADRRLHACRAACTLPPAPAPGSCGARLLHVRRRRGADPRSDDSRAARSARYRLAARSRSLPTFRRRGRRGAARRCHGCRTSCLARSGARRRRDMRGTRPLRPARTGRRLASACGERRDVALRGDRARRPLPPRSLVRRRMVALPEPLSARADAYHLDAADAEFRDSGRRHASPRWRFEFWSRLRSRSACSKARRGPACVGRGGRFTRSTCH